MRITDSVTIPIPDDFVSRAGTKLAHALDSFGIDVAGRTCVDLGCNVGGFVDCLLRAGAARVHAVDRGYGVLDLRLRNDPRVVVHERTDARTLRLIEPVHLVTIDVGWTRQEQVLPRARRLIGSEGGIITLIKPHYECPPEMLERGVLPDERQETVLSALRLRLAEWSLKLLRETTSPIRGQAGNRELLWYLRPRAAEGS